MITVTESLRQKAEETARQMHAQNLPVANVREAEGLVLIRTGLGYSGPANSTIQLKLDFDGGEYLLCEGRAEMISELNN